MDPPTSNDRRSSKLPRRAKEDISTDDELPRRVTTEDISTDDDPPVLPSLAETNVDSSVPQKTKEEPTEEPASVEHEEKTHEDDAGTSPPPMLKADPHSRIPMPIEASMRITAASFVSYCIAYAGVAGSIRAIPPSLAWVTGLLGSQVAIRLPIIAAVASPAAMMVCMLMVVFALACTTALLCAATVSDGLFVGLAAVWVFWLSGLRFGATAPLTFPFTAAPAVIFCLVGLGMKAAVQDGIAVQFDRGTLIEIVRENIPPPGSLQPSLEEILAALRKVLGLLEQLITTGSFCFDVEEGFLRGQEVCVEYNGEDDTVLVTVNGGIWLIKRFWTTTGVDNPLALFPNLLACIGWALLAIFWVAPLLPPVRTARYLLSVRALPQTLRAVAWYVSRWRPGHLPKTEEEMAVGKQLLESVGIYSGGSVAMVTVLEPRMLDYRCGIPRCTYEHLKEVTSQVERAALRALILRSGMVDPDEPPDRLQALGQTYEKNAVALETRIRVPERGESLNKNKNNEPPSDAENLSWDLNSLGFEDSCKRITTAVDDWLVSFHGFEPNGTLTYKDGLKNVAKNTLPWLLPSIIFVVKLAVIPFFPFFIHKGIIKKDLQVFMHIYVKFTIGYIALLCMSVYWKAWQDFELTDVASAGRCSGSKATASRLPLASGPDGIGTRSSYSHAMTASPVSPSS